jgi:hypothetical protein
MIIEVMAGRKKKVPKTNMMAPTLQASPQALSKLLDDKLPIDPDLKQKFKAIFDKYEALVKLSSTRITTTRWKVNPETAFDPAPEYLRTANANWVRTFSPLELIVTAILVQVHMDHRSDEDLLDDIKTMRKHLRSHHKDLRVNAQCWNSSWAFITTEMDKRRGVTRQPDDESSGTDAVRPPTGAAARRRKRAAVVSSSSSSRDRVDDDDDDDSSDLTSISSSDESDGIVFEGLMPSRPKPPPKPAATKAKIKAKVQTKGSKPRGVVKVANSKRKTKVSLKRGRLSNGRTSISSKKVRRS